MTPPAPAPWCRDPGRDSSPLVEVAFGLLDGTSPAEVVVAAFEPQQQKLEMGSGLTDELAEMAETMERQQVLVRAGEQVGVPVRIMANPSADLTGDLVALAEALRPQYLVAWNDDGRPIGGRGRRLSGRARSSPAPCSPAPLAVEWTPDPDGDEAVVVACRLAHRSGVTLGRTSRLGQPALPGDADRAERARRHAGGADARVRW